MTQPRNPKPLRGTRRVFSVDFLTDQQVFLGPFALWELAYPRLFQKHCEQAELRFSPELCLPVPQFSAVLSLPHATAVFLFQLSGALLRPGVVSLPQVFVASPSRN